MMIWKAIPGFYPYQVSDHGVVKSFLSIHGPKLLKPRKIGNYFYVSLRHNNMTYTKSVHSLVLLAHVGECPEDHECRHLSGDSEDNHLTNLKYGTRQDNVQDKIKHGSHRGERNGMSKLTEEQIVEIREMIKDGWMQKDVAAEFSISQSHVSNIINEIKWRDMS